MSRPKKDIEKLDIETVVEESGKIEDVTPEVVTDNETVVSNKDDEIENLKKMLADKNMQLEVLGSLTKRQVRGEVIKESKGTVGTIKIYNMKGE